ncbi:hypothetical protein Tco_0881737 [Tanacetum coccineum]
MEDNEIREKHSSKRAGDGLEQEPSKKKKVDDDKEIEELKQCMEIISDDRDDVTIEATPLSTKSPTIMLKNFDRKDLEVLWSIVKARFKKTEPVNYMDIFLHLNLKTMFEHHLEDSVWKNQQGSKLIMSVKWHLSFLDWSRNSLRKAMYLNEVFGSILLVIDRCYALNGAKMETL